MKILLIFFTLLFGLISCVTHRELAKLSVDSKARNGKIIDRYPDYGDGHRDGCIVRPEMHLFVTTKNRGVISGRVEDVSKKGGLANVEVTLTDQTSRQYVVHTDSVGNFSVQFYGQIALLKAEFSIYRSLFAKF